MNYPRLNGSIHFIAAIVLSVVGGLTMNDVALLISIVLAIMGFVQQWLKENNKPASPTLNELKDLLEEIKSIQQAVQSSDKDGKTTSQTLEDGK